MALLTHKFTILTVNEIMVSNYWHLILPGASPDKFTANTDVTREVVAAA